MTTITDSNGNTSTPLAVNGYEGVSASQDVIHEILGGTGYPDVTLRFPLSPTGTLTYLFDNEADAKYCESMHTALAVFTLSDDDIETIDGMSYSRNGNVTLTLDDDTRSAWTVAVDYRVVSL